MVFIGTGSSLRFEKRRASEEEIEEKFAFWKRKRGIIAFDEAMILKIYDAYCME